MVEARLSCLVFGKVYRPVAFVPPKQVVLSTHGLVFKGHLPPVQDTCDKVGDV